MNDEKMQLSDEQLERLARFVLKKKNDQAHFPLQDLAQYIELSQNKGEKAAVQAFPELSAHLATCDECLAECLLVVEAIHEDLKPTVAYQPDLSFLNTHSIGWNSIQEGAWQLLNVIQVGIHQTILSIGELTGPVKLQPAALYAMRSKLEENPPASAVEMSVDLPHGKQQIKLLLVGMVDERMQFILQGVEDLKGRVKLEGVGAQLIEGSSGNVRQGVEKRNLGLDFGLLNPGTYVLKVVYQEDQLEIPIQVNIG